MKAYITLLSTDNYYEGVLVLHRSLQAVKSKYPLHCVLSKDVSNAVEAGLVKCGIVCIRLDKSATGMIANSPEENYSNWNYSFDKLLIWGLTQYQKLVFVDSDMLILSNIDHLFEKEGFCGVCAGKSFPGHDDWKGVNSGLLVVVPDKQVESELLRRLPRVLDAFEKAGLPVGDQDVLNDYLGDKWADNTNLHLDEGYNLFADYLTYYIKKLGYSFKDTADKPIHVVHFIGKFKPWMKPTLRNRVWLLKMRIRNPYYFQAFRKFWSYL